MSQQQLLKNHPRLKNKRVICSSPRPNKSLNKHKIGPKTRDNLDLMTRGTNRGNNLINNSSNNDNQEIKRVLKIHKLRLKRLLRLMQRSLRRYSISINLRKQNGQLKILINLWTKSVVNNQNQLSRKALTKQSYLPIKLGRASQTKKD
jgi:hypothetical protein